MDFPIKDRDSIEARSGQRYSIDDKTVRQYLHKYTEDTFGDSSHIPASCAGLLSAAIDRNEGQANANFHDHRYHPLCTDDEVRPLNEDYNSDRYNRRSLSPVSKKRSRDIANVEANPRKRYCGLDSPNTIERPRRYSDNSESMYPRDDEEAWGHKYNGAPTHGIWEREAPDINKSSPGKPSTEISQAQNMKTPQLGSPLWKNASDYEIRNRKSLGQTIEESTDHNEESHQLRYVSPKYRKAPVHASTNQRVHSQAVQSQHDSKPGYDSFARKRDHTILASQNGVTHRVMETTQLILTQISKDSGTRAGSVAPQTPLNRTLSTRKLVGSAYAVRTYSNRERETTPIRLQPQSNSEKSETAAADSDESDSTPLVQLLDQMRYIQPHSQTDFRSSPYRASDILPRHGITFNERSEMKSTMPQTHHRKHFIRGGVASPIHVDSSPESPINAPPIKKSLPMKSRLSSSKIDPSGRIKSDPLHDRQRRAAEIIIRKEKEIADKEIFGEVIRDDKEVKLTGAESQQKLESKEKARLIKEEYRKEREREIKRQEEEATERERMRREKEEEIKRARREVKRKKQLAIDEAMKEERRRLAQEQIEASRLKEIADRERKEQDRQKEVSVQAEAAKRTEMELKREIARLQAASLKAATVFPSEPKKPTDTALNEIEEEESLFVSETNERSAKRSWNPAMGWLTLIAVIEIENLAMTFRRTGVLMNDPKAMLSSPTVWHKLLPRPQTSEVATKKRERHLTFRERLKLRESGMKI